MNMRPIVRSVFALPLLAIMTLAPASTVVAAAGEDEVAGHVYVLNNNLGSTNSITVFDRSANGALHLQGVTPIGGAGSLAAFSDGTQGSLIRTPDGQRLFAVDAGSDQISVLDVDDGHLTVDGVFPSGGAGPVSLTYGHGRLYVLNAANASAAPASVTGFRVDEAGQLHPISGATRPLSGAHPNPAQVQLTPDGEHLLVTEKGVLTDPSTGHIDIYRVASDGSLSAPTTVPSIGAYPFGMAFDPARRAEVLVDDGVTGGVTAYTLDDGQLRLKDGPVEDHQIAPCWIVITRNGRFAYTSNADSQAISGYRIHADGSISLLDANGATATTPADTFPLEESLTRNSRFLYVLDSRLLLPTGPGPDTLSGFRVEADGHLTSVVDPASITLPFSAIGQTSD
jgi:6-phosphogluconolactonase (cycloisomerase 2 family)